MPSELPTAYDANVEADLYERWEASGAFAPPPKRDGETTFSILMPPPNANASLHVGHAVFVTLQDLMTRYHRMRGNATVWFPGLDHAGFETQVVFEKHLEKEGKSRFGMKRQDFYDATLKFTKENSTLIVNQLRRLGASADWSRLKFTLDDDIVAHVYETFVRLYEDGLAYRDARPVNWCPKHQTTLSDLETKDEIRTDPLYTLQYGPLQVATGRPETIFADIAVAVHPDDERYAKYIGKDIEVDFGTETRSIPVVADEMVDREFGTGVVKITPAHDPNDFEVAKRHNLPLDRSVVDERGKLTELAGPFAGLKVEEARSKVVGLLASKGLIVATKADYQHAVKVCYKCGRTIEPRVLPQWFIAMTKPGTKSGQTLTELALKAVNAGKTKFVTPKFEKLFRHWLANIRDWPVSRQIAWGIRLPVWYCTAAEQRKSQITNHKSHIDPECPPIVSATTPTECPTCGSKKLERDPDTFDTWFSSGQWPVLVPKTTGHIDDFARFYPTSVMETGWDILFFWVARMLIFGLYLTDEVPFRDIYLHGLVRDKDRQKMSKSKGNVIDPLAVIDQYGADALRMALVFGTAAGNDLPMSEEKIRGMRNFTNKLWNVGRFVITNLQPSALSPQPSVTPEPKTDADRTILKQLDATVTSVTTDIETYRFHEAAQSLYHFVWDQFAAVYIEASKAQLSPSGHSERSGAESKNLSGETGPSTSRHVGGAQDDVANTTQAILIYVLTTILKLAHPFVPFVTEALWQELPPNARDSDLLIMASWPTVRLVIHD